MKKSSNTNKNSQASDNQQKTLFQFWKGNSSSNLLTNNENSARQFNERSTSSGQLTGPKPTGVLTNSSNFFQNVSTFSKANAAKTSSTATSSYFKSSKVAKRPSDDDIQIIDDDQELLESLMSEEGNRSKPSVSKLGATSLAQDANDDDEDEDLQMILASESVLKEKSFQNTSKTFCASTTADDYTFNQNSKFGAEDEDNDSEKLTVGIDDGALLSTQFYDTSGFDAQAGAIWVYPNNMPTRAYQYNIIEQCLHKNTMVVLPTGLGKTFVAAVVMLNFYRWYPAGKVIFMAPTKPLVAQQADACCKTVGIPKRDMTQMTGQMAVEKRKVLWATKRVFFLTPQIISNDILKGDVDVSLIKCVVIDEAHKALGDYAFCKVIESISELNKNFRIIALTATPGSDVKVVQGIIDKLLISHIELRSDESIDIQQYSNNRTVDKFVLSLSSDFLNLKNIFVNMMRAPLKRLEMSRVFSIRDPNSLNKLQILTRREEFRRNPPPGLDARRMSFAEADLALLMTLVHALELLTQYGVKSFYMFLKGILDNTDGSKSGSQISKLRNEIQANPEMANLYERLKSTLDVENAVIPRTMQHPKLIKLEEVILDHFKKFGTTETRVMIFSQYRESVYEITSILSAHSDIIKPMEFVGQSSTGGRKTVTQKEQLAVVKKFRDGGYNTLVSTCVGEEGLDIGEVDLIICYDSQKSPIRLIQRMGRTGRKREGRIVILLTDGKEEQSYKTSLAKKKNIYKIISNGKKNFRFYPNNPLMIPRGLKIRCEKKFIEAPPEDAEEEKKEKKAGKKKGKATDEDAYPEDGDVNEDDDENNETKAPKKRGSKKSTGAANSKKKKSAKSKNPDQSFSSQLPDLDLNFESKNEAPDLLEGTNLFDDPEDSDFVVSHKKNTSLTEEKTKSATKPESKPENKPEIRSESVKESEDHDAFFDEVLVDDDDFADFEKLKAAPKPKKETKATTNTKAADYDDMLESINSVIAQSARKSSANVSKCSRDMDDFIDEIDFAAKEKPVTQAESKKSTAKTKSDSTGPALSKKSTSSKNKPAIPEAPNVKVLLKNMNSLDEISVKDQKVDLKSLITQWEKADSNLAIPADVMASRDSKKTPASSSLLSEYSTLRNQFSSLYDGLIGKEREIHDLQSEMNFKQPFDFDAPAANADDQMMIVDETIDFGDQMHISLQQNEMSSLELDVNSDVEGASYKIKSRENSMDLRNETEQAKVTVSESEKMSTSTVSTSAPAKDFKAFDVDLDDLFDGDDDDELLMNIDEAKICQQNNSNKSNETAAATDQEASEHQVQESVFQQIGAESRVSEQHLHNEIESPQININNSTSTPLRSILKKSNNQSETTPPFAPQNLATSSKKTNNLYKSTLKNNFFANEIHSPKQSPPNLSPRSQLNGTMLGITQALELLNSSRNPTPVKASDPTISTSFLNQVEYQQDLSGTRFDSSKDLTTAKHLVNFDMKSDLEDLFADELEEAVANNVANVNENRTLYVSDESSIMCLSKNKGKSRKLCFDEASIMETSFNNKSVRIEAEIKAPANRLDSSLDESVIVNKKKTKKLLSDSSCSSRDMSKNSGSEKENSMEYEFNEALGNNYYKPESYMDKFADDFVDDDDDEWMDRLDEQNNGQNNGKGSKAKKRSKKSKFILDEADKSDDDSEDDSRDLESEGDNHYDLADSFVDNQNYSHDESAMHMYRKSVKSPANRFNRIYNRPMRPITDDIFSQMPEQDSSYGHDSFVVSDDHVSYYDEEEEEPVKKSKSKPEKPEKNKKLRRIKNAHLFRDQTQAVIDVEEDQKSSSDDEPKTVVKNSNKKKITDDSFDEDMAAIQLINQFECNKKNQFVLSKPPATSNAASVSEKKPVAAEPEFKMPLATTTVSNVLPKPAEVKFEAPKPLAILEANSEEDFDDEEFNKWLVEDTFMESSASVVDNSMNSSVKNDKASSSLSVTRPALDTSTVANQRKMDPKNITNLIKAETPKPENPPLVAIKPEVKITKCTNRILVDNSLLASSQDIISNLRRMFDHDKIIIQSGLHCDFILSQRLGAIRFKWSDFNLTTNKDMIYEKFTKACSYYTQVFVLLQDDREANSAKTRSKHFDTLLSYLTRVTTVLISKHKTDEIVRQLSLLSKNESSLGYGIDVDCNRILERKKLEIEFYLSLPNVSIINAFYLVSSYETISKFCNSTVDELKAKGKFSDKRARKLLKFLFDSTSS